MTDDLFTPSERARRPFSRFYAVHVVVNPFLCAPLFLGAIGIVTPESGEQNLAALPVLLTYNVV